MSVFRSIVSPQSPSVITTSSTSAVYFAPTITGGGAAVVFGESSLTPQPTSQSNQGALCLPGNGQFDGVLFSVIAAGSMAFGAGEASTTGKVGLYLSTALPTQSPNYQTLMEMTVINQAQDGVYYPFFMKLDLQGSSASGLLQIVKYGLVDGASLVAPTQVTALTGINFQQEPSMRFVCGVTFGASNPGNTGILSQFQITTY